MKILNSKLILLKSLLLKTYMIIGVGLSSFCFASNFEDLSDLKKEFLSSKSDQSSSISSSSPQTMALDSSKVEGAEEVVTSLKSIILNNPQDLCEQGLKYQTQNQKALAYNAFIKAAALDHPEALFHLAKLKKNEEDDIGARPFLKRSAELGYNLAQFDYGLSCLKSVRDLINNRKEIKPLASYQEKLREARTQAMSWFENSAAQGNALIQFWLAKAYSEGSREGIEPNVDKSNYWFHQAALGGHLEAQYRYATILENKGQSPDIYLPWYEKSVDHQNDQVKFNLSLKYFDLASKEPSSELSLKESYETQGMKWALKVDQDNSFAAHYRLVCHYEQLQHRHHRLDLDVNYNSSFIENHQHQKSLMYIASQKPEDVLDFPLPAREIIINSIKKISDHYCAAQQFKGSARWLEKIDFKLS